MRWWAALGLLPAVCAAWTNGPSGNADTDESWECADPPYSTHDWIAEHAVYLLPEEERAWLIPHMAMYRLGTEAPDHDGIPEACGAPNQGYDDRRLGHSVEWAADWSGLVRDRAARRAEEEYEKAVVAWREGRTADAAYYLGAMAHYIGDAAQYGHAVPFERHHSDYEAWVGRRTDSFQAGYFESYIQLDGLVRRRPYTAVKILSRITAGGRGPVPWATRMDAMYADKGSQEYMDAVGHSLNWGVNVLADVLHRFYLMEVNN
ncbi:MAG TPA: hypothetical protein ENI98_08305 [Gammaproteobacteria bacterium]|nr:hypothetical protein [Gammaproteobacteria bacterium]